MESSIYTKEELIIKINNLNNRIDNLTNVINDMQIRENKYKEKIGFLENKNNTSLNKIKQLKYYIDDLETKTFDKDFKFKEEQKNPNNKKLTNFLENTTYNKLNGRD